MSLSSPTLRAKVASSKGFCICLLPKVPVIAKSRLERSDHETGQDITMLQRTISASKLTMMMPNNNSIDSFYFSVCISIAAYGKWARHTIIVGQCDRQMARHTAFHNVMDGHTGNVVLNICADRGNMILNMKLKLCLEIQ
jgi:hypothetical protein